MLWRMPLHRYGCCGIAHVHRARCYMSSDTRPHCCAAPCGYPDVYSDPSTPGVALRRDFGARVRMLRHEAGLSQEELASRAGVHPTYVSSVERGHRNISLVNIYALGGWPRRLGHAALQTLGLGATGQS